MFVNVKFKNCSGARFFVTVNIFAEREFSMYKTITDGSFSRRVSENSDSKNCYLDSFHGPSTIQPEKLKDIATSLFEHFNSRDTLKIATKSADENDNRNIVFQRTGNLSGSLFRPTIENLIKWFESLGVVDEERR